VLAKYRVVTREIDSFNVLWRKRIAEAHFELVLGDILKVAATYGRSILLARDVTV